MFWKSQQGNMFTASADFSFSFRFNLANERSSNCFYFISWLNLFWKTLTVQPSKVSNWIPQFFKPNLDRIRIVYWTKKCSNSKFPRSKKVFGKKKKKIWSNKRHALLLIYSSNKHELNFKCGARQLRREPSLKYNHKIRQGKDLNPPPPHQSRHPEPLHNIILKHYSK